MIRLDEALERFARRMIVECLQTATAEYWDDRSANFAAVGTATCDGIALACHNRARLIREFGVSAWEGIDQDLDDVLCEAA